ncbi:MULTISPECIES: gas vesicle protein GvpG [Halorussus]|uniref:gas vesicle protein GvpG n=1 Tax=Halorussus TaxID=1070314 RepID=UPI0020A0CCA2|nr:protein gvpG [Halorussus vallis]USZ76703.1 protein gvpG [Halorussus vallis]
MFVVDDLLVRPFVGLLDVLHTMALDEMYDVESIRDDVKENRLLYELGEIPREEYERRDEELREELEFAERVRTELASGKIEVKR